jgi:hypothetical protein
MLKVAFRVVYRIKGRCSRHPAYNPVRDEQGGIKGGCEECYALFHAYRSYITLREAIVDFETTVHSFITNKQSRGRTGDVPRAFAPAVSLRSTPRRPQGNGDALALEVLPESGE